MKQTKQVSAQGGVGHTPGPWSVYGCAIYQNDCWNAGNNEGGVRIGSTFQGSDEDLNDECPSEVQYANARLIAAAPELLEACKLALDCIGKGEMPDTLARNTLESAISKAEGRQ